MITLKVGEVREVAFEFESDETFVIGSANYKIIDSLDIELSTGMAQIEGSKVIALFSATIIGDFKVLFDVGIETEIYKPISIVHVK
ncbi:hypothetical protein [Clostridium lacusfryxellense]|uniref:hypothetical protein n=1 Tax=Clostridium lacusfryxellense TaxID=205328 RepID=UPI001C0E59E9|nr:hypothetical protein [Clostridium lacusfryxellense]MBU3112118.1 hypothetical protein [Clostridium lacusfryxellense]